MKPQYHRAPIPTNKLLEFGLSQSSPSHLFIDMLLSIQLFYLSSVFILLLYYSTLSCYTDKILKLYVNRIHSKSMDL